jgi:hypothetical protein
MIARWIHRFPLGWRLVLATIFLRADALSHSTFAFSSARKMLGWYPSCLKFPSQTKLVYWLLPVLKSPSQTKLAAGLLPVLKSLSQTKRTNKMQNWQIKFTSYAHKLKPLIHSVRSNKTHSSILTKVWPSGTEEVAYSRPVWLSPSSVTWGSSE